MVLEEKILDADCDVGVGAAPPLQCLLEKMLGAADVDPGFMGIQHDSTRTQWPLQEPEFWVPTIHKAHISYIRLIHARKDPCKI